MKKLKKKTTYQIILRIYAENKLQTLMTIRTPQFQKEKNLNLWVGLALNGL